MEAGPRRDQLHDERVRPVGLSLTSQVEVSHVATAFIAPDNTATPRMKPGYHMAQELLTDELIGVLGGFPQQERVCSAPLPQVSLLRGWS